MAEKLGTPVIQLLEQLRSPEIYILSAVEDLLPLRSPYIYIQELIVSDNVLEACTVTSPYGTEDECAKFTIYNVLDGFSIDDVVSPGFEYTLSFWLKADVKFDSYVRTTGEGTFKAGSEWQKCEVTFTAEDTNCVLSFDTFDTFYIYNMQLELGNQATDYAPNPDDIEDKVTEYSRKQAEISLSVDKILERVSSIQKVQGEHFDELAGVKEEITTVKEEQAQIKIDVDEVSSSVEDIEAVYFSEGGEIDKIITRIRTVEELLTEDGIVQIVGDYYATTDALNDSNDRIESAESAIKQFAKDITLYVKTEDFTGEAVVSMINMTPESVKIAAENVDLYGAVTFSALGEDVKADMSLTADMIKNLTIGGRNLLLNTSSTPSEGEGHKPVVVSGAEVQIANGITSWENSGGVLKLNGQTSGAELYYRFMEAAASRMYSLKAGCEYTISGKAKIKTTSGTLTSLNVKSHDYVTGDKAWKSGLNEVITTADTESSNTKLAAPHIRLTNDPNEFVSVDPEGWIQFAFTHKIPEDATGTYFSIDVLHGGSWTGEVQLAELKLEKGNRVTDYYPAPEDFASAESLSAVKQIAESAGTKAQDLDEFILNWCCDQDKTFIDGAKIYTGTVTADQIAANAVTLGKLGNDVNKKFTDISAEIQDVLDAIPGSVTDLDGGENILYTKDVSVSKETTENGITKETVTVGNETFTVIKNGDFVILGQEYGEKSADGSTSYTYIDADGLLTAHNALIYGTVYATDGEFTGTVHATDGEFTGNITGSTITGSKITSSGSYGGAPTEMTLDSATLLMIENENDSYIYRLFTQAHHTDYVYTAVPEGIKTLVTTSGRGILFEIEDLETSEKETVFNAYLSYEGNGEFSGKVEMLSADITGDLKTGGSIYEGDVALVDKYLGINSVAVGAVKAVQDALGNVIYSTYAKTTDVEDTYLSKEDAASIYATIQSLTAGYMPLAGGTITGELLLNLATDSQKEYTKFYSDNGSLYISTGVGAADGYGVTTRLTRLGNFYPETIPDDQCSSLGTANYPWRRIVSKIGEFTESVNIPATVNFKDAAAVKKALGIVFGYVGGSELGGAPANSYKDIAITFGKTFSETPVIMTTLVSTSTKDEVGALEVAISARSTTGATIRVFNHSSETINPGIQWVAIGN